MLSTHPAFTDDTNPKWLRLAIFTCLALVAILQLFMVLKFEVNWDEFFLLDWVYKWNAGELNLVLQTIYFRAFSWLPRVSDNEATQIIAARGIMLLCLSITSGFIYSLCRKFTTPSNASLSLLFFLTMNFVFRNATSFRTDAIVLMVLTGVLWVLVCPQLTWRRVIIAGGALGLAGMITIKAIFYVPIIAAILLAHWGHSKWQLSTLFKAIMTGLLSMLSFVILYILHSWSIDTAASSANYLAHSANGSLLEAGLFPRRQSFIYAVRTNPILFILMSIGFVFSVSRLRDSKDKWPYLFAITLIFPLLTIIFYRHGYAYFYSYMLAPTAILVAIGLQSPIFKQRSMVIAALLMALIFKTAVVFTQSMHQNSTTQKQIINIVHELFPEPTRYIDRCTMITSYPKSGLFMSSWTMEDYYKKNTPIMRNILTHEQPKFILANVGSLDLENITEMTDRRFLDTDENLLKDNYIHHWGPIYVAGKSIILGEAKAQDLNIYIAGPYGVESADDLQINGVTYKTGDIVKLEQGQHKLRSDTQQTITLRWNQLDVPEATPPNGKLFNGF